MDVLEGMGLRYLPVERRAAIRAEEMQRRFTSAAGRGCAGALLRTARISSLVPMRNCSVPG